MESQRYETPEEAVGEQQTQSDEASSSEQQQQQRPPFLERYKRFPWWVKYGALIAILLVIFVRPGLNAIEILFFSIRLSDMVVSGLIAVLLSTVAYRFFEHKSKFVHDNAHWLFYAGMILLVIPLAISLFSPPIEAIDPTLNPE